MDKFKYSARHAVTDGPFLRTNMSKCMFNPKKKNPYWSGEVTAPNGEDKIPIARPRKNTHISKISNSVTHLRSYTKTAITDIVRNSMPGMNIIASGANIAVTSRGIPAPSTGIPASSADVNTSREDIVASNGEC